MVLAIGYILSGYRQEDPARGSRAAWGIIQTIIPMIQSIIPSYPMIQTIIPYGPNHHTL